MQQNRARRIWVLDEGLFAYARGTPQYEASESIRLAFERLMKKLGPSTLFTVGYPPPVNFFVAIGTRGKAYVLGHGSRETVGGHDPTEIAHGLVLYGGLSSGCTVTLVSCNTATSGWLSKSFAKKLNAALLQCGCDCDVVGRTGVTTVTPQGQVRTYKSWINQLLTGERYKSPLHGKLRY